MRKLLAALAVAALVCFLVWGRGPVRAQAMPTAIYVSGLHVDAARPGAFVRLTNTSRASADFYSISYLLFHADGNRAAAPVDLQTPLLSGRSLSIDVGAAVAAYRAAQDIAPFTGPVQVVVYGRSCADTGTCPAGATPQPFGPGVIHAEAVQTEGSAIYDAAVQWHVAQ